jgi:twinkle protein
MNDLAPLTHRYFSGGEQAQVFELQSLPNLSEIYKPALGFLNVWTGIPSHGKTELLNQVMVDLSINSDWKWLVFSPESYPHYYLVQNLAEKIIGKGFHRGNKMSEEELDGAIAILHEHIKVIDTGDGEFSSDDMLSLVREYTAKNSIQGVVIDPIGDLEISVRKSENFTYSIRRFLRMIRLMGRRKDFSPYIVAHTTKMQKDFKTHKYPVPTLYDIDGSAAYYNAAFHGISTYRYFKANVIAAHVQKVKFKPAGEIGARYLRYDRDTGIFHPYELPDGCKDPDEAMVEQTDWTKQK